MRILLLWICMGMLVAASAQSFKLSGIVLDSLTLEPVKGATVRAGGEQQITNEQGRFVLASLPSRDMVIEVSHITYLKKLQVATALSTAQEIRILLVPDEHPSNAVVVTAARRPEKLTNTAASIQLITRKDLQRLAGSNILEYLMYMQGIEFTRSGVDAITFNARGFNSAFNNKVLQLTDGRISMAVGSASLPLGNNNSVVKEDIERVEVVLGPQSALYGPNAHNAVINTITLDPRKVQGTMVSVTGANQYQFSGRFRQANQLSERWAFKLTGEYSGGKEIQFYDSVYAGGGVFGAPVGIPERNVNFNYRHIRGEGHVYYTMKSGTTLIFTGGGSLNDWLQVTTGGRNQMRGVRYTFTQVRFLHRNFFATVYHGWGSLGTSFNLQNYTRDFWNRTHSTTATGPNALLFPDEAEANAMRLGNQFKEENKRLNAEVQYNYHFSKAGLMIIAAASYQKDRPNSFGITLVDKDRRITVEQVGGVIQLEKTLPFATRLIAAARLDHHSTFGNFYAPKLGLIHTLGNGHVRLTWAKAYAMPSIQAQFANIAGFFFGNGQGITYIPNGAKISDAAARKITTPLKPEQVSTWELGYRGRFGNWTADLAYYNASTRNFLSPTITVTGRALTLGDIPLQHTGPSAGTVVNDTLKNAFFLSYMNYGRVKSQGVDAGLTYQFNGVFSAALRYSWFQSDITENRMDNDANGDGYVSLEERSLNAPSHRGVIIIRAENLAKKKLFAELYTRLVQRYNFYSGSQIGTKEGEGQRGKVLIGSAYVMKNFDRGALGGFVSVDLRAGFQMTTQSRIVAAVTNLFDVKQREFVGSPSIGRLIALELNVSLAGR